MAEKLKIINKLRELSNVDFNNSDYSKSKWCISCDVSTKRIGCIELVYARSIPFNIYFATAEDCKKAIETIGEYDLKKYYFDVEDNQ